MLVSLAHDAPTENAVPARKSWRGEAMLDRAVAMCKPGAAEAAMFNALTLVKTNTNLRANVDNWDRENEEIGSTKNPN